MEKQFVVKFLWIFFCQIVIVSNTIIINRQSTRKMPWVPARSPVIPFLWIILLLLRLDMPSLDSHCLACALLQHTGKVMFHLLVHLTSYVYECLWSVILNISIESPDLSKTYVGSSCGLEKLWEWVLELNSRDKFVAVFIASCWREWREWMIGSGSIQKSCHQLI